MHTVPALAERSLSRPVFLRVLCAINGTRTSGVAVRQALAISTPETTLTFVSVTDVRGIGPNQVAVVGEHRAEQALSAAKALARDRGVIATTELVHADNVPQSLLAMQAEHDVTVVGCHSRSRLGGLMTGTVATVLAHRTRGPLLVARAHSQHAEFPTRILVGVEDRRRAHTQVQIAAGLAGASGASLYLAHVAGSDYDARTRRLLADLAVEAFETTGTEPIVETLTGHPVGELASEAARVDADLLVLGRRGVSGLEALGSVSERLLYAVECSVLIVGSPD